MILPIDDNYRIVSDPYQWIVQKRRTRKGQEDWKALAYCTTVEHAVNELAQYQIRASDTDNLKDSLAEVEDVVTTLYRALTPQIKSSPRLPRK